MPWQLKWIISQQRATEAEHYKAVLAQREVEMEETKARFHKEAAQKEAEYQDLLK